MIGTFWNLCRACPNSMPLDKVIKIVYKLEKIIYSLIHL